MNAIIAITPVPLVVTTVRFIAAGELSWNPVRTVPIVLLPADLGKKVNLHLRASLFSS